MLMPRTTTMRKGSRATDSTRLTYTLMRRLKAPARETGPTAGCVAHAYALAMPLSPYVREIRAHIGHSLLLLPGVTAVITDNRRFLLARQRDTERWSLIGGGIEPAEEPLAAVRREVQEELGVLPQVGPIVGAYGGPDLVATVPNGDIVSYVTIAYRCTLPDRNLTLEYDELTETAWFEPEAIATLDRHPWIDRVVADARSN